MSKKLTCVSWLNGKHGPDIEINTSLPYVAIGEYFWQGEEADKVINEINIIYNKENLTVLEAIKKYTNLYLY